MWKNLRTKWGLIWCWDTMCRPFDYKSSWLYRDFLRLIILHNSHGIVSLACVRFGVVVANPLMMNLVALEEPNSVFSIHRKQYFVSHKASQRQWLQKKQIVPKIFDTKYRTRLSSLYLTSSWSSLLLQVCIYRTTLHINKY